jgi:hypothetical protein
MLSTEIGRESYTDMICLVHNVCVLIDQHIIVMDNGVAGLTGMRMQYSILDVL